MKCCLYIFSLLMLTLGYCENTETIVPPPSLPTPKVTPKLLPNTQGYAIKENQIAKGFNQSARILTNYNIFLSSSFIYWQASEGGLDLGHFIVEEQNENNIKEVINMNFKYKPGFKVALGTALNHDNWILSAEYTWLQCSNQTTIPADSFPSDEFLVEGWYYNSLTFELYAHWKLNYDMIDVLMQKPLYLGTHLIVTPFASIRGGLIKQYYIYKAGNIYFERLVDIGWDIIESTQNTWVVGPRGGMSTDWIFFKDFRIVSNLAASLCYQHFNNYSSVGTKIFNDSSKLVLTEDRVLRVLFNQLTPTIDGALGIAWGSYFGKNSWHFDLSLLYEIHYFWNQNKMRALNQKIVQELLVNDALGYVYSPSYASEDLMLQGLTLTVRFDF